MCMEFDHRDPSTKDIAMSKIVASGSMRRLTAELTKGEFVCANCHRIRTSNFAYRSGMSGRAKKGERLTAAAAILIVSLAVLAACGDGGTVDPLATDTRTATTTLAATVDETTTSTAADATEDPYEVYLRLATDIPADDRIELSREDAQLRALLGCGSSSAPGTIDALLAEAYAPLIEQWKAEGMCG